MTDPEEHHLVIVGIIDGNGKWCFAVDEETTRVRFDDGNLFDGHDWSEPDDEIYKASVDAADYLLGGGR